MSRVACAHGRIKYNPFQNVQQRRKRTLQQAGVKSFREQLRRVSSRTEHFCTGLKPTSSIIFTFWTVYPLLSGLGWPLSWPRMWVWDSLTRAASTCTSPVALPPSPVSRSPLATPINYRTQLLEGKETTPWHATFPPYPGQIPALARTAPAFSSCWFCCSGTSECQVGVSSPLTIRLAPLAIDDLGPAPPRP